MIVRRSELILRELGEFLRLLMLRGRSAATVTVENLRSLVHGRGHLMPAIKQRMVDIGVVYYGSRGQVVVYLRHVRHRQESRQPAVQSTSLLQCSPMTLATSRDVWVRDATILTGRALVPHSRL